MMRVSRMKTRAILSDVNANTRVRVAHQKGINILAADGSAKYLDSQYLGYNPLNANQLLVESMAVNSNNTPNTTTDIYWQRIDDAP
jgi:prepilin-type processing-associated H-X9-DG protein